MGASPGIYAELADAIELAGRDEGHDVRRVSDAVTANATDVVLAIGQPHDFPWLAQPSRARRVAWLGEPLPPAKEHGLVRIRRELPMGRLIDVAIALGGAAGRRPSARVRTWRERATSEHMQRVNLRACRRCVNAGIELVVTSRDQADALERVGLTAAVVPFGYHASLAGPTQPVDDAARDIDLLVFGAGLGVPAIRRARLVDAVTRDLGDSVRTEVVHGGLWGEDRRRLLGRSRVALTINQVPGAFLGIRAVLLGAAGVVHVSDPIASPSPFIPGVHYLEAPVGDLAATIQAILADRPRRLEMARRAQCLVVGELTMARSLDAVLATVA